MGMVQKNTILCPSIKISYLNMENVKKKNTKPPDYIWFN